MPEINWGESPPSLKGTDVYADLIKQAKEHPGVWGRFLAPSNKPRIGSSTAFYLRNKYGRDGFEVTSRTIEGQQFIYLRYVGDAQ